MKGTIIAFEGIDGAGKSTQVKLLKKHLENNGYKCLLVKGHPAFDGIKERILDQDNQIDPMSLFLLSMAKFKTISENLSRIRCNYDYVILDRYIDTAIAYSLANINEKEILVLKQLIKEIIGVYTLPDVTFLIDTPASVSIFRKSNKFDRIELGNSRIDSEVNRLFIKNQQAALEHYKMISKNNNYVIIDGNLSESTVFQNILHHINNMTYFG